MQTGRGDAAASGGSAPKKKRVSPKKFSPSEDAAIALCGANNLTLTWLDEALVSRSGRSGQRWRTAIKSKVEDKTFNHIKSKSPTVEVAIGWRGLYPLDWCTGYQYRIHCSSYK